MFLQPSTAHSRRRQTSRGFTLIELMVVVVIVGVTAALALRQVVEQMRERRSRDVAQRIALLYSSARLRALGRGSAVLVRYRSTTGFSVVESIQGTTVATAPNGPGAACANQAGLGCLANNWGVAADTWREVAVLTPVTNVALTVQDQAGAAKTQMDICFTPLGRSFVSFDGTAPTQGMAGATTFGVQRLSEGGSAVGLARSVAILPNGMSRVGL